MIKSNDREIVLFHDTMKVALALPLSLIHI